MPSLILLAFLAFSPSLLLAAEESSDTEETPAESPSDSRAKVSLGAELGFVWLAGNTRQISANGLIKFALEHRKNKLGVTLGTDYARAMVDGSWANTALKFSGELRYDRELSKRISLYALVGALRDTFGGYDYAIKASVGPAFKLIDNNRNTLSSEVGFTFIHDDYIAGVDPNTQNFFGARLFLGYALKISETASFTEDLEVTLGGTSNQDARFDGKLSSTTGLSADLAKGIAIKLGFALVYDFVVPDPAIQPIDTKTTVTLVATLL